MRWWLAVLLIAISGAATAQGYPSRPIRMIVPWPPGGGTDGAGRILAQALSEDLGTQVIVDNRGGASGHTGPSIPCRSSE